MSWTREFDEAYAVPSAIAASGLLDQSWHNDVCPSFGPETELTDPESGDVHDLRLWVEHPDEEMREIGGARFAVTYSPWSAAAVPGIPRGDEGDEIYSGDDLNAALRAFLVTLERIRAEIARRHEVEAVADRIRREFGHMRAEFVTDPGGWLAYSGRFSDVDDEVAAEATSRVLADWGV